MTTEKCEQMSTATAPIRGNATLCAYSGQIGSGVCNGDSGDPLVFNNTLIGIVSWSTTPCAIGQPDGYVRISEYVDWIEQTISSAI